MESWSIARGRPGFIHDRNTWVTTTKWFHETAKKIYRPYICRADLELTPPEPAGMRQCRTGEMTLIIELPVIQAIAAACCRTHSVLIQINDLIPRSLETGTSDGSLTTQPWNQTMRNLCNQLNPTSVVAGALVLAAINAVYGEEPAKSSPATAAPMTEPEKSGVARFFSDDVPGWIKDGKFNLNVRLRYEYADTTTSDVSHAPTIRTTLRLYDREIPRIPGHDRRREYFGHRR